MMGNTQNVPTSCSIFFARIVFDIFLTLLIDICIYLYCCVWSQHVIDYWLQNACFLFVFIVINFSLSRRILSFLSQPDAFQHQFFTIFIKASKIHFCLLVAGTMVGTRKIDVPAIVPTLYYLKYTVFRGSRSKY